MQIKKSVFIILAIILMACTPNNNSASSASTNDVISGDDVNKTITAFAPSEVNTFKVGDSFTVVVQNNSDDEIVFVPENKVILLMNNGNKWSNVDNIMSNSIPRKIILQSKRQVAESEMDIPVTPKVTGNNTITIRTIITGTDQSTGNSVRCYVDVTLYP